MSEPDVKQMRVLAADMMALGAELMALADAMEPKTPEVIYLARAIEGEGAALFEDRDYVGSLIAHVAMNRLDIGWWSESMVDIVTSAFHGYVNVQIPAPWSVALAEEAIHREEDIANGALFLLSQADLEKHGWGHWQSRAVWEVRNEEGHALYGFKIWPGQE